MGLLSKLERISEALGIMEVSMPKGFLLKAISAVAERVKVKKGFLLIEPARAQGCQIQEGLQTMVRRIGDLIKLSGFRLQIR